MNIEDAGKQGEQSTGATEALGTLNNSELDEKWRQLNELLVAGGFPRERTEEEEREIGIVRERWRKLKDIDLERPSALSRPEVDPS